MLRGFLLGVILSGLAAAAGVYLAIMNGVIPAAADQPSGKIERWVAESALGATLRAQAPKTPNPVALTDANLVEGVRLYGQNCSFCHGAGGGGATAVALGEAPGPPQFATDGVEDDPEGYTFWKIKHGIRFTGMPSWKAVLGDRQIWTLALFLKHMDKLPTAAEAAWKALPAPPQATPTTGGAATPG
jgi:thiosulfate dehydrogenase